jgi:hypothetical protein
VSYPRPGRSQALCLILLAVVVARGLAQTSKGEVTGRVDDSGGPLPGVTITVRSDGVAQIREVFTDQAGQFRVADLPDGPYILTFALSGFQTETRRALIDGGSHVDFGTVFLKVGNFIGDPGTFSDPFLTDRYIPALQRLFRYGAEPTAPEILLQFTQGRDPEMQIVADRITRDAQSAYRLAVWYLPPGSSSIYSQLLGLTKSSPDLSVVGAANLFPVNRAAITAAAGTPLAELLDGATSLKRRAPPLLDDNKVHYDLTIRHFSFDFSVTAIADYWQPLNDPVVEWMRQVRQAVEAQLPKH